MAEKMGKIRVEGYWERSKWLDVVREGTKVCGVDEKMGGKIHGLSHLYGIKAEIKKIPDVRCTIFSNYISVRRQSSKSRNAAIQGLCKALCVHVFTTITIAKSSRKLNGKSQ